MKSMMFTGNSYQDVMERIEGVMETLERDHRITGVTITSQGGGVYAYVGAVFYALKNEPKKTAQVEFKEGEEVWIRAAYVCDRGEKFVYRHVVTLNGADRQYLTIHDVKA